MKKLYAAAMVLAFAFVCMPLFAQETGVTKTPEAAAEPAKEVKKDVKKAKTSAFIGGEIVVKERAIANIEKASTTTEITDKDIKARSEKTLDETLEMVPGIKVETSNKGGKRFYMRGYDLDKVAIMVDGVLINDVYEANVDISQIPVINASRIIVNRGVSSALYGTNGAIGSINVITKKPEQPFAEANFEYGQYNNYTLNMAQGAPIGNAYFWITGTVMNSDGYEISKKLDKEKRTEWFNKLVNYGAYGRSFSDFTLKALNDYLNDRGKWNNTEYIRYQIAGKIGYNFTDNIEAGISSSYNQAEQQANTFSHRYFSSYDDKTNMWSNPSGSGYTTDGRKAHFQNRVFYWPDKYDMTVSPYVNAVFGDFSVKANAFYYKQMTELEAYATQDHSVYMFPASINADNPPSDLTLSIWTEQSFGVQIYPSYKFASWNKLNTAITYRRDTHTEEEQAVSAAESADVILAHGYDKFKTKRVAADYLTLAIEDEMRLMDSLLVSAGISYDAQNFVDNKSLDSKTSDTAYGDRYMAKDDSLLWGTRDSFNPVVGITHNTIPNLLKLRAAFSSKTKFPPLSSYARLTDPTDPTGKTPDRKMKPERSYNGNAGFDVMLLDEKLNLRIDYFYSQFTDKIERLYVSDVGQTTYTNIDGAISQGVEATVSGKSERLADIVDVNASVTYTYNYAKRLDDTHDANVNMGKKFEGTPEHTIIADLRFDFVTKTTLNLFGNYTINQIMYAMKSQPQTTDPEEYSTRYFKAVKLHNPLMLNVKLSQNIMENFDVYIMCKNVFDDYNADPFNPGPGRMFYIGGSARL